MASSDGDQYSHGELNEQSQTPPLHIFKAYAKKDKKTAQLYFCRHVPLLLAAARI